VAGALFAAAIVMAAIGIDNTSSKTLSPTASAIYLLWCLFALAYHPVCWYVFGATPGQMVVGARIARASDGQTLGIGEVLVRYLIFAMVTAAVPLGIVSAIMAANDPFQRAWHDIVSRSVVVRRGW
jgi:uncharacterized RDD family membrane protein YckC